MAVFHFVLRLNFAILLISTTCVHAQLTGDLSRHVVQSYGSGQDSFGASLRLPEGEKLVSAHFAGIDRRIATGVKINSVKTPNGVNFTGNFDTEGNLGYTKFTLIAKTSSGKSYSLPGSLDVVGVKFKQRRIEQSGRATAITPEIYAGQGAPKARLADCTVGVNGEGAFLERKDIVVAGNTLLLQPKYGIGTNTVGTGSTKIIVDCPMVGVDGEIAETDVQVDPSKTLGEQLGGNAVSQPSSSLSNLRNRYGAK